MDTSVLLEWVSNCFKFISCYFLKNSLEWARLLPPIRISYKTWFRPGFGKWYYIIFWFICSWNSKDIFLNWCWMKLNCQNKLIIVNMAEIGFEKHILKMACRMCHEQPHEKFWLVMFGCQKRISQNWWFPVTLKLRKTKCNIVLALCHKELTCKTITGHECSQPQRYIYSLPTSAPASRVTLWSENVCCVAVLRRWQRRKRSALQTHLQARHALHLCSARGHICWFLGPKIINLSADNRQRNLRTVSSAHSLFQTHMRVQAQTFSRWHIHASLVTCVHAYGLCCITNDGSLTDCLFVSECNGWSFLAYQSLDILFTNEGKNPFIDTFSV